MISLEFINSERINFNKYTHYDIPIINNVFYERLIDTDAKVNYTDLVNNSISIYLSPKVDSYAIKYQQSVLWHEFTHISDFYRYKLLFPTLINDILKSYSETHAKILQLRYLLDFSLHQTISKEKRTIFFQNKEIDLSTYATDMGNKSIHCAFSFIQSKTPQDFDAFMNYYFYFLGYIILHEKEHAFKLIKYVISKYPQQLHIDLYNLFISIFSDNAENSAIIYQKMFKQAVLSEVTSFLKFQ